jgi:XTP/dITP diphosphohydrolase
MNTRRGSTVVVATHNAGKLAEFRELLAPYGLELRSAAEFGLGEPVETEDSYIGNARIKAIAARVATGLPALADDSGIEIEALGGQPGIRTADWAEGPGGRDFGRAMHRAHAMLVESGRPEPWRARFRCALVLSHADGVETAVEGACEGRFIWPMRGAMGHGFDPIFLPDGGDRSFAELSQAEKNRISHRAVAVRRLGAACFT